MKNFILLAVSSILLVDLLPTHFEHNVDLSRAINVNGVSFNNVDTSSLGAAQVRQSASRGRGLGEKPKEGADKEKKKEKEEEPKKPNENKLKQPDTVPGGEEPAPGREQPAPGREEPAPGREQPAPGREEPAPGREQPAPGREEPAPGREQPAPGREQPAPGREEPAPGREQPAPGREEPAPAPGAGAGDGARGGNAGAGKGQGQNNQGANVPNEKVVNDYLHKIRSSVTTEWTPCSVTCGNGVRIRRKGHAGNKKAEDLTMDDLEVEACVMDKCAGIFNVVSNSLGLVILLVLALFN
uniref:Circumsporozoite protein n=1 Tax=Plasmodium knowlesi TaxID=5850 RepID=H9C3S4_PLAKN|nr:circumsporozoite protein [Plasmodium knowlesi]